MLDRFFGPQNRLVTLKLLRYSLLMVLVPLAVFYVLFIFAFKRDKKALGMCGIAAVIATNAVIASYVCMAYSEEDKAQVKGDGDGSIISNKSKSD